MLIEFYEKPGCINNTKQKNMLEAQGYTVSPHSILTYPWTVDALRPFFGGMSVVDWFNKAAPRIKSGEVNPSDFDETTAIEAMIADPLLIRRPLINADGELACGFDNDLVDRLLEKQDVSNLQDCPNSAKNNRCD